MWELIQGNDVGQDRPNVGQLCTVLDRVDFKTNRVLHKGIRGQDEVSTEPNAQSRNPDCR